jgi:hypothetical protein
MIKFDLDWLFWKENIKRHKSKKTVLFQVQFFFCYK